MSPAASTTISAFRSMTRTRGGGFCYHAGRPQLYLGLVVHLDYATPRSRPFDEFQRFKQHPADRPAAGWGTPPVLRRPQPDLWRLAVDPRSRVSGRRADRLRRRLHERAGASRPSTTPSAPASAPPRQWRTRCVPTAPTTGCRSAAQASLATGIEAELLPRPQRQAAVVALWPAGDRARRSRPLVQPAAAVLALRHPQAPESRLRCAPPAAARCQPRLTGAPTAR